MLLHSSSSTDFGYLYLYFFVVVWFQYTEIDPLVVLMSPKPSLTSLLFGWWWWWWLVVVGARVEELSKQSRQAQCSLRRGIGCVKRGKKEEEEEKRRKKKKTSTSRVGSSSSPPHLFLCCYNDRSSSARLARLYYSSERVADGGCGGWAGCGPTENGEL